MSGHLVSFLKNPDASISSVKLGRLSRAGGMERRNAVLLRILSLPAKVGIIFFLKTQNGNGASYLLNKLFVEIYCDEQEFRFLNCRNQDGQDLRN